ncbi:MAG: RNA 2',3'-cyclic phosphodiesterase [Sedimentisphaerales bacterium]|nr:RNA 2',3'-cyclic phosphodiesterase [Sedimentisphaerales bacterium]
MRVFIAIDIDEVTKKDLSDLQNELQGKADIRKGDAKWVDPENMHLTLKFLGDTRDAQVVEVCNIAGDVASRHNSFDVDVETVGYFGGKSARVLWVGAGQGSEELSRLQQDLDQQLAGAGWPKDNRKYSAHLTLCRIRNAKAGFELARLTDEYKDCKLGTIPARAVIVYQSELTPQGPVYTVLGGYQLQ